MNCIVLNWILYCARAALTYRARHALTSRYVTHTSRWVSSFDYFTRRQGHDASRSVLYFGKRFYPLLLKVLYRDNRLFIKVNIPLVYNQVRMKRSNTWVAESKGKTTSVQNGYISLRESHVWNIVLYIAYVLRNYDYVLLLIIIDLTSWYIVQ